VNALPTSLSLSSATICNEPTATLTASATNAASYSLNGSTWTASTALVVTPTVTTSYTLYAKTTAGCTASVANAGKVTVNVLPTGLSLSSATICNGQSTTLTASATNAASYSLNGSTWTASTALVVTPTANTTYTLYAKTTAGCTATKTAAGTVVTVASPSISYYSGETSQTVNARAAISDIVYTTPDATSASLTGQPPGVTVSLSDQKCTISGSPTEPGNYEYTLTVLDDGGCFSTTEPMTCSVLDQCTNCASYNVCETISMVTATAYEPEGAMTWDDAHALCYAKGYGWRLPSRTEAQCFCDGRSVLPGKLEDVVYWLNDCESCCGCTWHHLLQLPCRTTGTAKGWEKLFYVKCVR
jgi:hypothetical protein